MLVRVNGVEHTLPEGSTIADLMVALKLPKDGFAVAVDRAVVPRGEHARTALQEGQAVEVIRAVGGG